MFHFIPIAILLILIYVIVMEAERRAEKMKRQKTRLIERNKRLSKNKG